jgi:hypothetical protein
VLREPEAGRSRGRASKNRKKPTKPIFLNHEDHEEKTYVFLRDLRGLRGDNLPFSNSSASGVQSTVLKAPAAK